MAKALIIVDVQNDFVEGGSLAVQGGKALAARLAEIVTAPEFRDEYDVLVTTQDWHIDPGDHFAETPDFVDSWPVHCKADEFGGAIVDDLAAALNEVGVDLVIKKGQFEAAYSGFEGNVDGEDTLLADALRDANVTAVDVVGIATDYCVRKTALDAATEGFDTTVLLDLCAGINPDKVAEAVEVEFPAAGVAIN